MGFIRFRKRIQILPGVRLNVGTTGVSLSAGSRGAQVTIGKTGARATVGLPGSGLSYTETLPESAGLAAPSGMRKTLGRTASTWIGWIVVAVIVLAVFLAMR